MNGTIVVMTVINESQALCCGEQQGLLGNVVVQQMWMNQIQFRAIYYFENWMVNKSEEKNKHIFLKWWLFIYILESKSWWF